MGKITEYADSIRFDENDVLLKDGDNGTKKIEVSNAAIEFAGLVSSVHHRNVYRGKSLGDTVTEDQKAAIADGTFDDLFIGDYWTISGVNYVIADMDYFFNTGDTNFNSHHLVIVPSTSLYSQRMNSSNSATGGYAGSEMKTSGLANAISAIETAFGDMVKTHRDFFSNAISSGKESAGAWSDSEVDLMSEIMVYGCRIQSPNNELITPGKGQLALFRLNPAAANIQAGYWLRDVISATSFAFVTSSGAAYNNGASSQTGVRPYFCIG